MRAAALRLLLEGLGWLLVVAGVAALLLPGPGLLMIFAGLVLLSQQYRWAERRVAPVRLRALRLAADSVESWPRIALSTASALVLVGLGLVWLRDPPPPTWWPVRASWWLLGGRWTGVTLVVSGLVALTTIGYSVWRFRGDPEARAALDADLADGEADGEAGGQTDGEADDQAR